MTTAQPEPFRAPALAIQVRAAHKRFADRAVLANFTLEVRRSEFVALLGASGSGKTTLLRALLGLETLDAGNALVARRRSVVFQEPRLIENLRVRDNVILGRARDAQSRAAAAAALAEVGLAPLALAWPDTLSGGEAQRVALARALVREPELLLLDEPFGALDALTRIKMHELLAGLCARHRPAVLLVTHDVDEAILLADRVAVLRHGELSLDLPIALARPRMRGQPGFAALRRQLLSELGVSERVGGSDREADPPAPP